MDVFSYPSTFIFQVILSWPITLGHRVISMSPTQTSKLQLPLSTCLLHIFICLFYSQFIFTTSKTKLLIFPSKPAKFPPQSLKMLLPKLWSRSGFLSFSLSPHSFYPFYQRNLLALPLKYTQNPVTSHHLHTAVTCSNHHPLWPG